MNVKQPSAELERLHNVLKDEADGAVESLKRRADEIVKQAETLMAFVQPDALGDFLKADRVLAAPLEVRSPTYQDRAYVELRVDGQAHAQFGQVEPLPVGNHRVLLLVFLDKTSEPAK